MALKKNLIANYAGQGWSVLMGLAFLPLYIDYMGVESYALVGFMVLLQAWFSILDMGMTPTLSREMARFSSGSMGVTEIRTLLRSIEVICFGGGLLVTVCIAAGSGILAKYWLQADKLSTTTVTSSICIMAVIIGLRFCETIYRASLLGLQRQVLLNTVIVILTTLRSAGVILILAFVSPTIEAFLLWYAAITFINLAMLAACVHLSLPKTVEATRFSLEALKKIREFAGGMMVISILFLLVTQVDKLILSKLLSLRELGFYVLASSLTVAFYRVTGPVSQAIYPRFVQLSMLENEDKLARTYHLSNQLIVVLLAPMAITAAIFPVGIIYAWSGNIELSVEAGKILAPLAMGTFLNCLMKVPYHIMLAYGWTSLTIRWTAISAMILIPSMFIFVPRFGGVGAAWIWFSLNAGYVLVLIPLMHKRILVKEQFKWYLQDVAFPAGACGALVLVSTALAPAEYSNRIVWGGFIAIIFTAAFLVTLGAATSLRHSMLSHVKRRWNRLDSHRIANPKG